MTKIFRWCSTTAKTKSIIAVQPDSYQSDMAHTRRSTKAERATIPLP